MKLPTIDELANFEKGYELDALSVLLNQPPPTTWLKQHPTAKYKNEQGKNVPVPYLPIDKVEYLLTKIFRLWWVEVREVKSIANSVVVTVRLWYINPLTQKEMFSDGVGATAIQTDSGAGAMEWDKAKAHGVQIAAPAAETYAIKDAAEKLGRLFGKDLARNNTMDYANLMKKHAPVTIDELREELDKKRDKLTVPELKEANEIINKQQTKEYARLLKFLKEK